MLLRYFIIGLLCFAIPVLGFADTPYIGAMSMLDVVMSMIFGLCRVAGVIFTFTALIYYRRYRQNPNETPLGKVLWTLVLGIGIFFFPLLAQYNTIYNTISDAGDAAAAADSSAYNSMGPQN